MSSNIQDTPVTDQPDQNEAGISAWVKSNLGMNVVKIERQRRWRPVWRVDVEGKNKKMGLLFKSDRAWPAHPYPLIHEWKILQVLADAGIPIPRLYGMCPRPEAITMEWVRGGRDPGLVMEAMENKSVMTEERWAASLAYMEILARMHKIDSAKFVAAGLEMPHGPEEIALNSLDRFHRMCANQQIVDPFMEFCAVWLRRNVPPGRSRVSFVTGDCGQFLSEGKNITAVIDMEVGHLGDHHHDLACFRGRHPIENMGDLPALFRHYEKALGEPIDFHVIAYHTVVFLCVGYYAPLFALNKRQPGGDWVEAAVQVAMIGRRCAEALAEITQTELDDIDLPKPRSTPLEDMALWKLEAEIKQLPLTKHFLAWQRGNIEALPRFLLNQTHYSHWAEEEDLSEAAALLGKRPGDPLECDRMLVDFVRQAGPESDAALIRLFHRRLMRQCKIIAGPGGEDHLVLVKLEPILDRI
jgi:hypothetical protein